MGEAYFRDLLLIALGQRTAFSNGPSYQDWIYIFNLSQRQSVLGVCMSGIEQIGSQDQKPPMDLLLKWIGYAELIKSQNEKVSRHCQELQQKLNQVGLSACILKGQGVAQYYDEPLRNLRQSGDIDVWIKGGYDVVCDYVQSTHPNLDLAYHRFHYKCFEDTEVELHQHPSLMNNPFHNRILQRWAESFDIDSFPELNGSGFRTPSSEFNKVFLLCHIYRHFIAEGVGLRQLMDYYFVLKNSPKDENEQVMAVISRLGMKRFAAAVMWIMGEVFGLEQQKMLCWTDEREGRYLLNEVMLGGNFGKSDERYRHSGRYAMQVQNIRHSAHLVLHYPSEVLWSPLWLIWHFFWKKIKIRKIKPKYNNKIHKNNEL